MASASAPFEAVDGVCGAESRSELAGAVRVRVLVMGVMRENFGGGSGRREKEWGLGVLGERNEG